MQCIFLASQINFEVYAYFLAIQNKLASNILLKFYNYLFMMRIFNEAIKNMKHEKRLYNYKNQQRILQAENNLSVTHFRIQK